MMARQHFAMLIREAKKRKWKSKSNGEFGSASRSDAYLQGIRHGILWARLLERKNEPIQKLGRRGGAR